MSILSASEQVAARTGNRDGDEVASRQPKLADERAAVGRDAPTAALRQLEKQDWIVAEGHGRRPRIWRPFGIFATRKLRMSIFLYEKGDSGNIGNAVLLARIQEAGFQADFAAEFPKELALDGGRASHAVKEHPAE